MHRCSYLTDESLWPDTSQRPQVYGDHHAHIISSALSGNRRGPVWSGDPRLDERVFSPWRQQSHTGPLPGGGLGASGPGGTDGGPVRPVGGRNPDGSPRFDQAVRPGGYLWWYVDALSDDGAFGLTIIAFVGSVFSPYYYWALQKNPAASPEDHCAINVALYGRGIRRWSMTERGQRHVRRDSRSFQVGPSHLRWTGAHLEIQINEWSAPIPRPVRGVIRVIPDRLFAFTAALDDGNLHHWGPLAPSARVEVALESPNCSWQGHAYLDSNEGASPIAEGFTEWDWSRANLSDGSVAVLYDVRQRQGPDRLLALRFGRDGEVTPFDAPARQCLPKALWRVGRSIRSESGRPAHVLQTLEDTPFYVRSLLESSLCGERVISMHETLNVPRLNTAMTRLMLPWKMPRLK